MLPAVAWGGWAPEETKRGGRSLLRGGGDHYVESATASELSSWEARFQLFWSTPGVAYGRGRQPPGVSRAYGKLPEPNSGCRNPGLATDCVYFAW